MTKEYTQFLHSRLCSCPRFRYVGGKSTLKDISQPLPINYLSYTRFNNEVCDSKSRFCAGVICSKEHSVPGKVSKYDPEERSTVADEGPFTVCIIYMSS